VASTRRPWVTTFRIAQPEELCATKQSPSSKIRESKLWHIKEQFGRGLNLAATSVLGHVTAALASAVPELDSTPINKLTDDMRSFVFDGAVRSVPSVTAKRCIFPKICLKMQIGNGSRDRWCTAILKGQVVTLIRLEPNVSKTAGNGTYSATIARPNYSPL